MNGRSYDIGQLGLFLFLAFILPGSVYLGFFIFYFPSIFKDSVNWTGLEVSVLFLIGLSIIGGLLLTSICFAIEIILRDFRFTKEVFNKCFPDMGVRKLAKIEAEGNGSLYLYQVTGQAVMHFNIGTGISIILLIYIINIIFFNKFFEISLFQAFVGIIVGIITLIANFYVAKEFYKWGKEAVGSLTNTTNDEEK